MADDFEKELDRRQQMIAEKLAEIGIVVQLPIPFVKIPGGPIGGQIPFVWDDSTAVQQTMETDDEFAQIAAAMREEEVAERERARKEAEEQALKDLQALAEGSLDDDE